MKLAWSMLVAGVLVADSQEEEALGGFALEGHLWRAEVGL